MIVSAHFVARWLERVEGNQQFADMKRLNPAKTELELLQLYLSWQGLTLTTVQKKLSKVIKAHVPRGGVMIVNNKKWWVVVQDNRAVTVTPSGTMEADLHIVSSMHKKLKKVRAKRAERARRKAESQK